jgi:hypothetical protein
VFTARYEPSLRLISLIKSRVIFQAVSRRPLNAEARLRSQVNPSEMCDEVTLQEVFLRVLEFPLDISSHQCSILILNYTLLLTNEQRDEARKLSVSNSLAFCCSTEKYCHLRPIHT